MLRSNRDKQQAYEFVSIEELVPQDHLLRKVDNISIYHSLIKRYVLFIVQTMDDLLLTLLCCLK
ncbi:transposase [Paenibacillus alvei TS-15]|jgi:hypothetical protein|uniref:Transposase n=1 Tax=Paenibacillus alvei TS-15 TaxID=1117108 RepID=S9SS79_PAEAL|nr:transposase [Paenibacillus alvei TS-15]